MGRIMKEVSFDFEGLSVYRKALDFVHHICNYDSLPIIIGNTCFRLPASIKHSN